MRHLTSGCWQDSNGEASCPREAPCYITRFGRLRGKQTDDNGLLADGRFASTRLGGGPPTGRGLAWAPDRAGPPLIARSSGARGRKQTVSHCVFTRTPGRGPTRGHRVQDTEHIWRCSRAGGGTCPIKGPWPRATRAFAQIRPTPPWDAATAAEARGSKKERQNGSEDQTSQDRQAKRSVPQNRGG